MGCNCMDLTTTPGTLVIFANPENGYEFDQKRAREFLDVGCAYTVAEIDVDDSSSRVRFEEYPGVWFNTVLFNNIGLPPTPADLGETSRILYREIQRIDNDLPPQP